MAACFASRDMHVVGVDISDKTVESINSGTAPVSEPGLSDLISSNSQRLSATTDVQKAISETDISFIVVPTPSKDDGSFSLKYVSDVSNTIGRALAKKSRYHLIVLTSTVLPGSTQYGVQPILERESGKRCGKDFGICYNPEFIALGSVIQDFLNPDFLLIGESDKRAGNLLEDILKSVAQNDPPTQRMNYINAEMAKIALNSFVTTKITFANMLAEMSGKLPGTDVDTITDAIGLDSRIGRRYLKGGLSYGGPCFPRDNRALGYIADKFNCNSLISESTDQFNQYHLENTLGIIQDHTKVRGSIAVLGLSYKPNSNVLDESPGLYLAEKLSAIGYKVKAFDPVSMENVREILKDPIYCAESIHECLSGVETVVIANPDAKFSSISAVDIHQNQRTVAVIDCWRMLRNELENKDRIVYVGLGIGKQSTQHKSHLAKIWNA
tara:strand:- start:32098 stop:33417 length:1320 start_codon:yes stop_codon:yes gene_type:complete